MVKRWRIGVQGRTTAPSIDSREEELDPRRKLWFHEGGYMICERQIISWLAGRALNIGPRGLVEDVGWISRKSGCTREDIGLAEIRVDR